MPAADRFLPKAGLLWDGPVRPTTRGVRPSPRGATRCSCTWCWLGSIEPTNVVFAALAESSLVEDHTGWSICKIVRPAAGTAPSRSASEATNAPPKTQPLPTSTARSRRSTRSVVRTNLSQVGAHSVHGASGRRAVRRVRCESQAPCQMSDHQSRFRRSSRVLPLWSVGHPCFLADTKLPLITPLLERLVTTLKSRETSRRCIIPRFHQDEIIQLCAMVNAPTGTRDKLWPPILIVQVAVVALTYMRVTASKRK